MRISQCLITKNEEKNIEHCLSHLKSVVDEQIVVDTGSTDATVEIAERLGAKVFHFDWINDFSAARNFTLDKAKGDWIIFLDCDEYFSKDSVPFIRENINKHGEYKNIDGLTAEFINIKSNGEIISTVKNVSPRIFKRKNYIRYKNKIHEVLANTKTNESLVCADVSNSLIIYHTGYDVEEVKEKNKNERNIELLKKELEINPENSKVNYYLSRQLNMEGKYKEALVYAEKALQYKDNSVEYDYYCTIYSIIMMNMLALSKSYDDIKSIFNIAVKKYPFYPDYYWFLGKIALRDNRFEEATQLLEKCVELCNNYNNPAESLAVGKIDEVYIELLNSYNLQNNKHKVVEVSVALLKVDKFNIHTLIVLLKTFLTQEKEENIINFLSKIYNYKNLKDVMFLIKTCDSINNSTLKDYYISLLNNNEKDALIKSGFLNKEE